MFPLSYQGQFELGPLEQGDVDAVLHRIEHALAETRATSITRTGNQVTFRGGMFRFVSNWNVLVPVGYGEIEVLPGRPGTVRYNLSCMQMLVIATIMAVIGAIVVRSLGILMFAWLWLFGMNYLIGAARLPSFVARAAGVRGFD